MKNKNNNLELDFERINILFSNAYLAHFGMVVSVLFLYFIVHKYSSPDVAVLWGVIAFVTYLPRVAISIIFKRKLKNRQITPGNISPWEGYYILSAIFPFLCLASVADK